MKHQTDGILDSYTPGNSHYDEIYVGSKLPRDHYATMVERNLFHTHCRKYVADAVHITEQIINNSK